MTTRLKIQAAIVGVAFALLAGASTAQAATITLGNCHTGDCGALTGSVGLTYSSVVGGIELTIANNTNGDVTELNLLFGGIVGNSDTTLTGGGAPSFTTYVPSTVLNGASMSTETFATSYIDGSLSFNVRVDLPPPPGQLVARLAPGDSITFWIAGLSALNFQNAMAHVQSLGPGDGGSVKLTPSVPDGGATVGLLGLGLLGLAYLRRRLA